MSDTFPDPNVTPFVSLLEAAVGLTAPGAKRGGNVPKVCAQSWNLWRIVITCHREENGGDRDTHTHAVSPYPRSPSQVRYQTAPQPAAPFS